VFKGKHWIVKYNPLSLVFGGGLLFYQGVISPQIMQGCAFNPSCSNFSKQCIKSHGLIPGIALSADRLTRCTRLSSIDFHPVLFDETGKVSDPPEYYRLRRNK
jgi:putative component of membrane protein insertase Oxa1/YidC/SpoIIIJ protein YidD